MNTLMNQFTPFGQLPPVAEFLKKRSKQLVERLYNLRLDDVQTEERYNQTREFIRAAILPQPVVFGEPIFSASLSVPATTMIAKFGGKLRSVVIRQITLPFTGSKELFGYAPNKSLNIPPDAAILTPADGYLTVKLHTIFFSRYDALKAARHILNATLQMIAANNEDLKEWVATAEDSISRKLLSFRKECEDLYIANNLLTTNNGS